MAVINKNDDDSGLITLRFLGELNGETVPIYDLGQSLVAIQRIVHKAHLSEVGQLTWAAKLPREQRQRLALRVARHEEGSDVYQLVALLDNPGIQAYLAGLAVVATTALARYVEKLVVPSASASLEGTDSQSILSAGVYNEVEQLVNRIGQLGNVAEIEFSTSREGKRLRVTLNESTRDYVRAIKSESAHGPLQEIRGTISVLHTDQAVVELRINKKRTIWTHMERADFEILQYHVRRREKIALEGWPIYRLGSSVEKFREFRCKRILVPERPLGPDLESRR